MHMVPPKEALLTEVKAKATLVRERQRSICRRPTVISSKRLTAEIEALRADLETFSRSIDTPPTSPEPDPPEEPGDATTALFEEIRSAIQQATESAEDLVSDHPAAAIGSAFLLGFLIGRSTRGPA